LYDYACAFGLGDGHGIVCATAIDHNDFADPRLDRPDRPGDAIRFILGDDEAGYRQSRHSTELSPLES
jgi:hypothetical protein